MPSKKKKRRNSYRFIIATPILVVFLHYGCTGAGGASANLNLPQEGVVYFLDDHLGNAQLVTDSLGNVMHEESRYPYGLERSSEGEEAKPYYSYTGKEYDEETGLVYFGGRYYSPSLGRWITPDPAPLNQVRTQATKPPTAGNAAKNPWGEFTNLYSYVDNNPMNRIDPDGFRWEYSQSSGNMTHVDDDTGARTPTGTGYSGHDDGLNNPAMQDVQNVGPIPQGTYDIGQGYNHNTLGPNTMNLDPQPGTDTFGRSAFRIHGDNRLGDNSASEGCIIQNRNVRDQINNSDDRVLEVLP